MWYVVFLGVCLVIIAVGGVFEIIRVLKERNSSRKRSAILDHIEQNVLEMERILREKGYLRDD